MVTITHQKTNNIADWTQADLDAVIAGNAPPLPPSGTVLNDIVLPSDWNHAHTISGGVANAVLYTDGSGNLAQDANLTTNGSSLNLGATLDYGAQDIDILNIGNSAGVSLRFRWASIFGTGGNEFRLDDTNGVLQPLYTGNLTCDNLYTGAVTASSTIDGTTITASVGFAGEWAGNTIPVSRGGTGTGTTFTDGNIVIAGVAGVYTESTGYSYDATNTRQLISNTAITPQSHVHLYRSTGVAVNTQYANVNTGSGSGDGTLVGITSTGVFEIKQQENLAINIYTLGTLRATYDASASPRYTVYGGMSAQYNALANTSTDGLLITNLTTATVGTPIQRSGRLTFSSQGYDTGAAASRNERWVVQPVLTSGNPVTSYLSFEREYNGGGFTSYAQLSSAGVLTLVGGAIVPDEAYGSSWNGSLAVPTKNAVYDKIENVSLTTIGFTASGTVATGKVKGFFTVPYAASITGWNIVVDAGTATIKVWKIATGTAKPTSSNSINTSGVGISTGTAVHSNTVSDFTTTTVAANDIFAFNIEAVSGVSEITFNLELTKS